MRRLLLTGLLAGLTVLAAGALAGDDDVPRPADPRPTDPRLSAGKATVESHGLFALFTPINGLTAAEQRRFEFGRQIFIVNWLPAPAAVNSPDGLGPLFSRLSCENCHERGGRTTRVPAHDPPFALGVLQLSYGPDGAQGEPRAHPAYGRQLDTQALAGLIPEGRIALRWESVAGAYADGTVYELRRPVVTATDLAHGPLGNDTRLSYRVPQPLIGLAQLEAIPEATLERLADPHDTDGDDISGRLNHVGDITSGALRTGRFGWKAGQPDLHGQVAVAASLDMGITTGLYPDETCSAAQAACRALPSGGKRRQFAVELPDNRMSYLLEYLRWLGVPARRHTGDAQVQRGETLFAQARCGACHVPALRLDDDGPAHLAGQVIQPFTDLLLHDMGEDLADGRGEWAASGSEWRTAPLWGLGRLAEINGPLALLHDGRARSFAEAILWHGGEGAASREAFRAMPTDDRAALITFLQSL